MKKFGYTLAEILIAITIFYLTYDLLTAESRGVKAYQQALITYKKADYENAYLESRLNKWQSKGFANTKDMTLFIGDSYFEFWHNKNFAGTTFKESFDRTKYLNIGVGGTKYSDWDELLENINITVNRKEVVKNISLEVKSGEILGIAGIDGNGQMELAKGIYGLDKIKSGKIFLNNKDITNDSIRKRSIDGISLIPEDRHKHGLVLDYSLENNMILQRYWDNRFSKYGLLLNKNIRSYTEELIMQYDIRSNQGPITKARSMSGGNQQKAVIAREIDRNPDLLIAVQPTRGLDVGAIEYIHRKIVEQRDKGKAVLLISLELDEIMSLSDRILVIYEGEIVGEFNPKTVSRNELGLYMSGAKRSAI